MPTLGLDEYAERAGQQFCLYPWMITEADDLALMSNIGRRAFKFRHLPKRLILNEAQTLGVLMMDDVPTDRQRRGLAIAFALCALATLGLLANHPGGSPKSFAELIKDEVAHQLIDGVVHGGFVFALVALIVCFVFLSRFLGLSRPTVVIALVCFCAGCIALAASMVLDGLVTPAIAARFAGTEDLQPAKTLFIFVGTLIRFLMPLGLMLQYLAIFGWSWAIVTKSSRLARVVGLLGLVAALSATVAIVAIPAGLAAHVILGGITLQVIWYLAIAVLLFHSESWPLPIRQSLATS